MNRQEIYNKVRDGLLNQGSFSFNEHEECVYRSFSGNRCSIGFLIPDENYDEKMEGDNVESLIESKKAGKIVLPDFFNEENSEFLMELQEIHDNLPVERWETVLKDLAIRWWLEP